MISMAKKMIIKEMYEDGLSKNEIKRRTNLNYRTVCKYAEQSDWNDEKLPNVDPENYPVLGKYIPRINEWLENDKRVPRKQRHTAKRIYDRLVSEMGYQGGESTVRGYVRELKDKSREAFVPLEFMPGEALQVDWGDVRVWLRDEQVKANLFCGRLCFSDAPFVLCYRRQNAESFQDALVRTFEYFGGTPRRVIFDNARTGVKEGFGAQAKATDSYAALAAHHGFETVFCNPSSGNEKGLVEGLVGFSRRNFCVPVPRVADMEELNTLLQERCQAYLKHIVPGKGADVETLFREEQTHLYPLPKYRYDPAKRVQARVNTFSTVRFETNSYSVPVKYCGQTVIIKALPERIEIWLRGETIASHSRCYGRECSIYQLEHYLPLLERKGRALFQARPVRDNVPPEFLDWLSRQECKPKELVTLLQYSLELGFEAVMRGEIPSTPAPAKVPDPVEVNEPDLSVYDSLCTRHEEVSA